MNIDKTGQNNQTTTFNTRSANAGSRTYQLVLTGIFAAITAVCSWISIPLPSMIPINLAILGVLLSAGCLGFKCGTMSQIIYVLLGAIGVPVFAGFSGGFHVIAGPTGGYIIGYILCAMVVGFVSSRTKSVWALLGSMIAGVLICYTFGTIWYIHLMNISFAVGLAQCVLPFLPGDALKIAAALFLITRLRKTNVLSNIA